MGGAGEFSLDTGLREQRYATLDRWVVGATIWPATATENGSVARRLTTSGMTHFDLYLTNNILGARFTSPSGVRNTVSGELR